MVTNGSCSFNDLFESIYLSGRVESSYNHMELSSNPVELCDDRVKSSGNQVEWGCSKSPHFARVTLNIFLSHLLPHSSLIFKTKPKLDDKVEVAPGVGAKIRLITLVRQFLYIPKNQKNFAKNCLKLYFTVVNIPNHQILIYTQDFMVL